MNAIKSLFISFINQHRILLNLVVDGRLKRRSYIGATDEAQEGNWVWLDGSQFQFRNWKRGEPNNQYHGGRHENCAMMGIFGFWNDVLCRKNSDTNGAGEIAGYICSYKLQGT